MRHLMLIISVLIFSKHAIAFDPIWGNSNVSHMDFQSYIREDLDAAKGWSWWNCSDNSAWPLYDGKNGRISCPFATESAPRVFGFNPLTEKIDPDHGWVLYKRQMYVSDETPVNLQSGPKVFNDEGVNGVPHFVVYNKYTGELRFFAYVGGLPNSIPNGQLSIIVNAIDCSRAIDQYACSDGAPRNDVFQADQAILPSKDPAQPLIATFQEPNQQPQARFWYVFNTKIAYLPDAKGLAIVLKSDYRVTTTTVVKLTGTYSGVVCDDPNSENCISTPPANALVPETGMTGIVNKATGVVNAASATIGGAASAASALSSWFRMEANALPSVNYSYTASACPACGYFRDPKDLRAFPQYKDAREMADEFVAAANFLDGSAATFLGKSAGAVNLIASFMPGISSFAGTFDVMMGLSAKPPLPKVSFSKGNMEVSGVLSAQRYVANNWNMLEGAGYGEKIGLIPYYAKTNNNTTLGMFGVLRKPKVYVVVSKGAPIYVGEHSFLKSAGSSIDPMKLSTLAFFDENGKWSGWAYTTKWYYGGSSNMGTRGWSRADWNEQSKSWIYQHNLSDEVAPLNAKFVSEEWASPMRWIFTENTGNWLIDNPSRPTSTITDYVGFDSPYSVYQGAKNGLVVKNGRVTWARQILSNSWCWMSAPDPVTGQATSYGQLYNSEIIDAVSESFPYTLRDEAHGVDRMRVRREYAYTGPKEINAPSSYGQSHEIALSDDNVVYLEIPPGYLQYVPPRAFHREVAKWLESVTGAHFPTTVNNDYNPIM